MRKSQSPQLHRFVYKWWPSIVFSLIVMWLLWPAIYRGDLLAFRDALHFYYPTWSYLSTLSISEQFIPQWNPLDGFGSSWIGEPTSMAFYPLRWILILPLGSLGQRIGTFLATHLVIGYLGSVLVMRRLGTSALAAQLTGISFALSGPVFFQIYNPVYLVGASWLPLAMGSLFVILKFGPTLSSILGLSVNLSLMILGGDSQVAYHVLLCGMVAWSVMACRFVAKGPVGSIALRYRGLALIATGFIIAALSAIQLIPSRNWILHSDRMLDAGLRVTSNYDFSVAPWHFLTTILPNVFGDQTNGNTRWSTVFPGEGRMWVPSLHMGIVAIGFAIVYWTSRDSSASKFQTESSEAIRKFTLGVFILAALSSLGHFSLGWLWNSLMDIFSSDPNFLRVSTASGSLQAVWNACLPFYNEFRYPAKWLCLVAWSVSVAGGIQLDRFRFAAEFDWARRIWQGVYVAAAILTIISVTVIGIPPLHSLAMEWLSSAPSDPWCGDLQVQKIPWLWLLASVTLAVIARTATGCLYRRHNHLHPVGPALPDMVVATPSVGRALPDTALATANARPTNHYNKFCACFMALILLELAIHNRMNSVFVSAVCPAVAQITGQIANGRFLHVVPERSVDIAANSDRTVESEYDACQAANHKRLMWLSKMHLLDSDRSLDAQFSATPIELVALLAFDPLVSDLSEDDTTWTALRNVFRWVESDSSDTTHSKFDHRPWNIPVWTEPFIWNDPNGELVEPHSSLLTLWKERFGELSRQSPLGLSHDVGTRVPAGVSVEDANAIALHSGRNPAIHLSPIGIQRASDASDGHRAFKNVSVSNSRWTIEYEVSTLEWIAIPMYQEGGWQCRYRPSDAGAKWQSTIAVRGNGLWTMACVPPGSGTIEFMYTTPGLGMGAAISAISWLLVLGSLVFVTVQLDRKTESIFLKTDIDCQ